jgi:hypothetical protein
MLCLQIMSPVDCNGFGWALDQSWYSWCLSVFQLSHIFSLAAPRARTRRHLASASSCHIYVLCGKAESTTSSPISNLPWYITTKSWLSCLAHNEPESIVCCSHFCFYRRAMSRLLGPAYIMTSTIQHHHKLCSHHQCHTAPICRSRCWIWISACR